MALNYLVDTLRSFRMRYIDRKQERLHSSTFGDQSSFDDHLKGDESTGTKRRQRYTILSVEATDVYNAHEF